jgi:Tfp pilus assembly protein PilW
VRSCRRIRGITLVETVLAAVITGFTLLAGFSVFVVGLMGWLRGEGGLDSEETSHTSVRIIANELRQAVAVGVDSNGLGLSYSLPLQNQGTDVYPEQTDGVARRIELDGTDLNMKDNIGTHTLCQNMTTKDPSTGQPYKIFTPGAGTSYHAVTVEVCTVSPGYTGESVNSRNRESIYLRNVPQINN